MGDCGGGTSAQHRSGWQSVSEASKDKGQRRQYREERCDGAPTKETWRAELVSSFTPGDLFEPQCAVC